MQLSKLFYTLPILGFFALSLQGQISNEQVEIFKDFDAQLTEAKKIEIKPSLPEPDTAGMAQEYVINAKPLLVEYLPPRIRPISLRRGKLPDAYNGYVRLGGGNPSALFGEGSYYVNNDNIEFGLNALHHSSNNNRNVENQRFAVNRFGLSGGYHFDQGFALIGDFGYDLDYRHFFGYNNFPIDSTSDALSFEQNEVRQRFSTFKGGISFFNDARTQGDFDYKADFDFYLMDDNFGTRENGAILDLRGTKWFNDKNPLSIGLLTDLTGYKDTANQSLSNFILNGSYTYHSDAFKVKGGLSLGFSNDEFAVFPDIEVAVKVIGNYLTVLAGGTGGFQKNTFQSLTEYNPFLESQIQIRNTTFYNVYAGVQGEFLGINYRLKGEWKPVDDLALFLNNGDTIPRFQVIYDTGTVVSIVAELDFTFGKDFTIGGSLTQNFFNLDNNEKPWQLPSFILNTEARYTTLEGKLELVGSVFVENGVPVPTSDGGSENLNALFDVSIGGEYLISKNFGVFLQFNNLANVRRQRWQFYPTYGFNVIGGLSARF